MKRFKPQTGATGPADSETMKNKSKRVYIAGPMTGLPNLNRVAFFREAEKLRAAGHVVLNPADLPEGLTEAQYMDITLAMVRACCTVLRLPGWSNSAGAVAEISYAKKLGLDLLDVLPSWSKPARRGAT